jgi:hypothetical protein
LRAPPVAPERSPANLSNIATRRLANMIGIAGELDGPLSRVVRIDRTVRRRPHQNTPGVHALLTHLEQTRFDAAPRALGFDAEGREIVSYIAGTAGHYPLESYVLSESTLIQVARLLRRYHDATATFSVPEASAWRHSLAGPKQVICHGDAGPYNIIFRGGSPVAFIDFEHATPGPRVWDIAFMVYRFAPLCGLRAQSLTPVSLKEIARRIRIFSSSYGVSGDHDLFHWIQLRLKTEIDLFHDETAEDAPRRRKQIEDGHLALYQNDLRSVSAISGPLRRLI